MLLWCCLLLAPLLFSQANGRALTCQHHPEHPASYSLTARTCKAWCLCVKQIVKIWMQICCFFVFFLILLFFSGVVMLVKQRPACCSAINLNSSLAIRMFWSPLPVKTLFLWRKPKRWGFVCVQEECGHRLARTVGYEACLHIMHSRNTKLHYSKIAGELSKLKYI